MNSRAADLQAACDESALARAVRGKRMRRNCEKRRSAINGLLRLFFHLACDVSTSFFLPYGNFGTMQFTMALHLLRRIMYRTQLSRTRQDVSVVLVSVAVVVVVVCCCYC